MMRQVHIFLQFAREYIYGRCVNLQLKLRQQFIDLVIVNSSRKIRKTWPQRNRFSSLRKLTNLRRIVIFFDMFSGTGDRYGIKDLKEIKVHSFQQIVCCSLFHRQFAPGVEGCLRLPEYFIDRLGRIQFLIDQLRCTLISQCELVLKIIKTVVYRCSRKHQNLRLNTSSDNLVQKFQVPVFLLIISGYFSAITEIMRFIDDHKVIVTPVQPIQIKTI